MSAAIPAGVRVFESAQQTITAAGLLTLAHGLGARPRSVELILVCQTAELGYAVGDQISTNRSSQVLGGATTSGIAIYADATNIYVRFGSATWAFTSHNKGTGASNTLTNANWKVIAIGVL